MPFVQTSFSSTTIAAAAVTTPSIPMPAGKRLVAIQIPAGMTNTALKFKAGYDNASNEVVYVGSTELSITITSSARFILLSQPLSGKNFTIYGSGAEAAERTLGLVFES